MTTNNILRYSLNAFLLFSTLCVQAQTFSHKAKINAVNKAGFYRIPLSANMASLSQAEWQDLRIFDAKGKEVPYVLRRENPYQNNDSYTALNIQLAESGEDWQTLVIENPTKTKLNHLLLDMQNAVTDRSIRISGSDNLEKWYGILDSVNFTVWGNANETTLRQGIRFPSTNYAYFKIEINKKNKEPLNILQAGYSVDTQYKPVYKRVNNIRYTLKEQGQKTHIDFTFDGRNRIDRLQFYVREPKMYQRDVFIKTKSKYRNNKYYTLSRSKHQRNAEQTEETTLNLNNSEGGALTTHFILGNTHQEQFSIDIQNNNNPPLQIDSIVAEQLNAYLVAELKSDTPYFLYMGDSNINAPIYDLVYFETKIPTQIPDAIVDEPTLKQARLAGEDKHKNEQYKLWGAMGILAVFLLFITRNLMKKIEN